MGCAGDRLPEFSFGLRGRLADGLEGTAGLFNGAVVVVEVVSGVVVVVELVNDLAFLLFFFSKLLDLACGSIITP